MGPSTMEKEYLFYWQIFTEHLFCARLCSRPWYSFWFFSFILETGPCYNAQADLKLLDSNYPPVSVFQWAGNIGLYHHAWLGFLLLSSGKQNEQGEFTVYWFCKWNVLPASEDCNWVHGQALILNDIWGNHGCFWTHWPLSSWIQDIWSLLIGWFVSLLPSESLLPHFHRNFLETTP